MIGAVGLGFAILFGGIFIPVGIFGDDRIFLLVGVGFFLIFGSIGFGLARAGRRNAAVMLRAFEHGVAARGEIDSVDQDMSVQIDGRSPWVVRYTFQAQHREFEGKTQTFDHTAHHRLPGQPLHVLYVKEDPTQNTIYPPFK
jgi:hypothetical protein